MTEAVDDDAAGAADLAIVGQPFREFRVATNIELRIVLAKPVDDESGVSRCESAISRSPGCVDRPIVEKMAIGGDSCERLRIPHLAGDA